MRLFLLLVVISPLLIIAQQKPAENIIVITTDGLRWQEVFAGMDSAIANNARFNEGDSAYIFEHYWAPTANERRKKLMPFLWDRIAGNGAIYGNRNLGSQVDNSNPFWFSYPGYSEILTGYADTAINSNSYPPNPNVTVLEFLNQQPATRGKVAAFGAWEAFDRIINEERSGIPVVSAFDSYGGKQPNAAEKLMNQLLKDSYKPWHAGECLDVFTHYGAVEHLKTRKPRVLYIAYGETDEWAHAGKYRSYLDAAKQVDAWIAQLWELLQADPFYKGKTSLFITTDHGRGDVTKTEWTDHGNGIKDAYQIWFAAMGPNIRNNGEVKDSPRIVQAQFAQTIAAILGKKFTAKHPVAKQVDELLK